MSIVYPTFDCMYMHNLKHTVYIRKNSDCVLLRFVTRYAVLNIHLMSSVEDSLFKFTHIFYTFILPI